jgi:exodeoxyribonuclease VII large subunit
MINVSKRRFPAVSLYLYPSLVQGPSAPAQMISALKALDDSNKCDVIIIGRGGGSAEDLWCFNDENLAYAIYNCKTPIISAVGHETDFTICDFVADLRAPTPSAAAELAVPDVRDLKKQFSNVEKRMLQSLNSKTDYFRQRLLTLSQRPVLQSPKGYFDERRMTLARDEERLWSVVGSKIEREKMRLFAQSEKLNSLNPLSVLGRGFSVAFGKDGKAIRSVSELPSGTEFELMLKDGKTKAISK